MEKSTLGQLEGNFTWGFGEEFFIETSIGNFTWSDPDYGGDNVILPYIGEYKDWCKDLGIPFGRDKGRHLISDYCRKDFFYKEE